MEEAVPETESYAVGVEVRRCVVAEVFGVAEDEADFVLVVRVPGDEWKNGRGEGECPDEVDSAQSGIVAIAGELDQLPKDQSGWGDDCGLFREGSEGEENCGPE